VNERDRAGLVIGMSLSIGVRRSAGTVTYVCIPVREYIRDLCRSRRRRGAEARWWLSFLILAIGFFASFAGKHRLPRLWQRRL